MPMDSPHRPSRRPLTARLILALAVGSLTLVFGGAVGAQTSSCADVTVTTPQDLVTAGPTTIGPISVDVGAGRYRLLMTSIDRGHRPGHQTHQRSERWSFTLDSGYSSPITADLAEDATSASFDMGLVDFVEATSITFHHHGAAPSPDSISASVTFQCAEPVPTTAPPTTEPPVTEGGEIDITTAAPDTSGVKSSDATQPPTTRPVGATANGELPRTGGNPSFLWMGLLLMTSGGVFLVVGKIITLEAQRFQR